MASCLEAVAFEVADASSASAFWAGLLDREAHDEPGGAVLVPGDERQVGLRFVPASTQQDGHPHLHLHLTSTSLDDQQRTVDRALELGGRHLDVGQAPEDRFVVLADPQGNELCVIEPDNSYLAGTGYLGEVTCEGTHAVGLFWRDALDWALVWDENEETVVQSSLGGTKVAFSGTVDRPAGAANRQRFDLVADDLDRETRRLLALGAQVTTGPGDPRWLLDPDGARFTLRA